MPNGCRGLSYKLFQALCVELRRASQIRWVEPSWLGASGCKTLAQLALARGLKLGLCAPWLPKSNCTLPPYRLEPAALLQRLLKGVGKPTPERSPGTAAATTRAAFVERSPTRPDK